MTQRLRINQPVFYCPLPYKRECPLSDEVSSLEEKDLDVWDDNFYLTIKNKDKAGRSVLVYKLDQIKLPPNMCSFLCGQFWLFATLPAHALYQNVCDPIHKPIVCPIIWFCNYLNCVT